MLGMNESGVGSHSGGGGKGPWPLTSSHGHRVASLEVLYHQEVGRWERDMAHGDRDEYGDEDRDGDGIYEIRRRTSSKSTTEHFTLFKGLLPIQNRNLSYCSPLCALSPLLP